MLGLIHHIFHSSKTVQQINTKHQRLFLNITNETAQAS